MRRPEVRAPFLRRHLPLRLSPLRDPLVIARQQHLGHALDERLAITWPLAVTELSPRDRAHARLAADLESLLS